MEAMNKDKLAILDQLVQEIVGAKILGEIQKLMFNRSHFARFLIANNYEIPKTIEHFKEFLNWRKSQKIDNLIELEFNQYDHIKEFFPNGFHSIDKKGRPIFIIQFGSIKIKELLEIASADTLIRYMLKEIEHTWRIKFNECTDLAYKPGVDQMIIIIDLKGAKLKDLSNKQINVVFRSLLIEYQRYYPEMLNSCFILNTPMFFEGFWESEIKPHLNQTTLSKIIVTGESTHKDLIEKVDQNELPKLYGGACECEATCVYSDRGPWADVENKINFQNRQFTDMGIMGGQQVEEFKLQECDDDQIDLLNDKKGLQDLKHALQMNIPGDQLFGDDLNKIKNNTIIDPSFDNDQELLKNMLMQNLPGLTPMNTQIDEDRE